LEVAGCAAAFRRRPEEGTRRYGLLQAPGDQESASTASGRRGCRTALLAFAGLGVFAAAGALLLPVQPHRPAELWPRARQHILNEQEVPQVQMAADLAASKLEQWMSEQQDAFLKKVKQEVIDTMKTTVVSELVQRSSDRIERALQQNEEKIVSDAVQRIAGHLGANLQRQEAAESLAAAVNRPPPAHHEQPQASPAPPSPAAGAAGAGEGNGISLFCFAVMRVETSELSLMRYQLEASLGIFACAAYDVLSDKETWLSQGPPARIMTTVLDTDMVAATGQQSHILNTRIFRTAWEQIKRDGRYKAHDWVVKVDPDTVFFPDRLLQRLAARPRNTALYYRNCNGDAVSNTGHHFRLYGALEVLSREAVDTFLRLSHICSEELDCKDWGEDLFMQMCLDHLKVRNISDFGMLSDAYCPSGLVITSCASVQVAFHPFKDVPMFKACVAEAKRFAGLVLGTDAE